VVRCAGQMWATATVGNHMDSQCSNTLFVKNKKGVVRRLCDGYAIAPKGRGWKERSGRHYGPEGPIGMSP
jgi:hypothetical protein